MIPASQWRPLKNSSEPNEAIQIDFGGRMFKAKGQDVLFLQLLVTF